jgi:hypothetical protein
MSIQKQPDPTSKTTEPGLDRDTPSEAPSGLASGLQPGGTIPGKSPGNGMGSIGTGGASDGNRPTGAAARQSK